MGVEPLSQRVIGTETEYGIVVVDKDKKLVPGNSFDWTASLFTFANERYRLQAWRVGGSANSTARMSPDGGRFYSDHGHPEWSTPEEPDPFLATLRDKAGEYWLRQLCREFNEYMGGGRELRLYKNNWGLKRSDNEAGPQNMGDYNSYAGHCNFQAYSSRVLPHKHYKEGLKPLLVVLQIFSGAGGVLRISEGVPQFVISNRAQFMEQEEGLETTRCRPVYNTKNEVLGDKEKYRRIHVISQDVNVSEVADFLKLGLITAALCTIECGCCVGRNLQLANPARAIKQVSRDPTLKQTVQLFSGEAVTGVSVLKRYLDNIEEHFSGHVDYPPYWMAMLIDLAGHILEGLEKDPASMGRYLDWSAKYRSWLKFERGETTIDRLDYLDQSYPQLGSPIYESMLSKRDRLFCDEEIMGALQHPPAGRPAARVRLSKHFPYRVGVDWDALYLLVDAYYLKRLAMPEPMEAPPEVAEMLRGDYAAALRLLGVSLPDQPAEMPA